MLTSPFGTPRCLQTFSTLVLFQSTRTIHSSHYRKVESSKKPTTGERAVSLLEELFPQKTVHKVPAPEKKSPREIPRLPLDLGLPFGDGGTTTAEGEDAARTRRILQREKDLAILVVRKAGKCLDQNDFKRVMPSGKHIEGWTQKGGILRVIRGRDIHTLEPQGVYFVLFASSHAAEAYKEHVMRLHRLAQTYSPRSLTSPVPPPPDLTATGEGSYGPIQSYTLVPPSQELSLRLVEQPFSPVMRRIVEQSGYDQLVREDPKRPEVLIWIDGYELSTYKLRDVMSRDARDRGMNWGIIGRTGSGSSIRTISIPTDVARSDKSEFGGNALRERYGPPTCKPKKKCIVAFRSDEDAQRFVVTWHRRDITALLGSDFHIYDDKPVVNAELIW